jgi:hypothetical protein
VTFRPSDSIAIANCLASISVGNDFVSLAGRDAPKARSRNCFGVSTETNQWLVFNLCWSMMNAMAGSGHAKNVMCETCRQRSKSTASRMGSLSVRPYPIISSR